MSLVLAGETISLHDLLRGTQIVFPSYEPPERVSCTCTKHATHKYATHKYAYLHSKRFQYAGMRIS